METATVLALIGLTALVVYNWKVGDKDSVGCLFKYLDAIAAVIAIAASANLQAGWPLLAMGVLCILEGFSLKLTKEDLIWLGITAIFFIAGLSMPHL